MGRTMRRGNKKKKRREGYVMGRTMRRGNKKKRGRRDM